MISFISSILISTQPQRSLHPLQSQQCPVWQPPLLSPCWLSSPADSLVSAALDFSGFFTQVKINFPKPITSLFKLEVRSVSKLLTYPEYQDPQCGSYLYYNTTWVLQLPLHHHCPEQFLSALPACLAALKVWPGALISLLWIMKPWTESYIFRTCDFFCCNKLFFLLKEEWIWGSDTFTIISNTQHFLLGLWVVHYIIES